MLSMLKNVADYVTPVLTESHFADKGVLTPEEFVLAGDQLVFSCPTWQWSGGQPGTQKSYLPPGKQFLITRNVPSLRRAHTYALADAKEEVLRGADDSMQDGEGWLSTHSQADMERNREVADIDDEQLGRGTAPGASAASAKPSAAASSKAASSAAASAAPAAAHDDEIGDIDDLDADMSNLVVKPAPAASAGAAAAAASAKPAPAASAASSSAVAAEEFPDMEAFDDGDDNVLAPPEPKQDKQYLRAEEPEDNIVKTRTYDISITWDKYYRTPRVYLFGYDEHRQPLTPDQIMEDISADHANKTVTVEPHPFLGISHASIHPCKHAHVMKRIVDQMQGYTAEGGHGGGAKQVDVKQSMFIFLKFISSVIPTIEYDFSASG